MITLQLTSEQILSLECALHEAIQSRDDDAAHMLTSDADARASESASDDYTRLLEVIEAQKGN